MDLIATSYACRRFVQFGGKMQKDVRSIGLIRELCGVAIKVLKGVWGKLLQKFSP